MPRGVDGVPGARPKMRSAAGAQNENTADMHYYLWVDQFDTLGMGANTVVVNGTNSDSLIAFDRDSKEFVRIRIPYR